MVLEATDAAAFSNTGSWWKPTGELYIAGVLCLASVLVLRRLQLDKKQRLPPGPKAWPIVGSLHELALAKTLPHQALTALGQKYGPLMFFRMGKIYSIVVSSPDMAREVCKTQDQVFASRPNSIMAEVFCYNREGLVFAPLGEQHRLMRKACWQELFAPARVAEFQDVRREEIVTSMKSMLRRSKEGEIIDMKHTIIPVFYNVVTRMICGKSFYKSDDVDTKTETSEEAMKFHRLVKATSDVGLFIIGEFIPWLRWMDLGGSEAQLERLREELGAFFNDIIEEHRRKSKNATDRQDFVDVLLGLQQNDTNLALTDTRMKAFLQDLLLAGIDTGSTHVLWTLTELMRHPEQLRKAQAEIDAVVGKDRLVKESDLVQLNYLRAVIKESFRLHPVLPLLIPHESIRATTIAGYNIPDNTRVFINAYAIGRDPQTWENPLEFNPERFLGRSFDLGGQSFEILPFGSGRRVCVGLNLALVLVEITLATWIHSLEFVLPAAMKPSDIDVVETSGVTVTKKTPLKIQVKARLSAQAYEEVNMIR